ncbi:pentapeptide repeat-containing protein [Oceanirhabdus seepicola]|uniref:Pentapeptide repeat-containing protein n=1 Tax=Oceanirhabdus seepicola TaxID=2828781 RepID=A0A9J6NW49_9CLOT|nr:pentapeptide repeat-containing protein [Oceanirhabdus seepicola]MCM1988284.1 pentapeptide repeat-containing protein [Oceanirhabdus seepicola]
MARNQSVKGNFNYNNIEKKNKNFMYKNLHRSNCYNSDFSNSNFDYVSFRGAHFKSCTFLGCTFRWAEFIGTNLKGSIFKKAKFENTIFDSVNLDGVDFKDAEFKNTIFLSTDTSKAKNLNLKDSNIRIFDEMPQLEISAELEMAVKNIMKNDYVKKARIFDTKDGNINVLNLMILLDNFDESTLIKGLNIIKVELDRAFYTLSYIIKLLKNYKIDGNI